MFEMTEREYKQKLKRVEEHNKSYERRQALRAAKIQKKIKFPATSKIVLFSMIILCVEIVAFAEYAMLAMENMSAMYALIGIPVALTPTIWGYYSKSKAENTKGGITYETAMANMNNIDTSIKDENNACG